MNKTSIEWTDLSANPLKYRRKSDGAVVWGCVKHSPGCAHCYSEALALRYQRGKLFNARNMEELEPFLDEKELHEMLYRKTCDGVKVSGSRCFVGDMTDVFGGWVPDEMLDRLFAVFAFRSDVTWQVLTKRANRMARYFEDFDDNWGDGSWRVRRKDAVDARVVDICGAHGFALKNWPLPNLWLGVSVEDQQRADERIPWLLKTPAAVRFLSCEPLLGPVDLTRIKAAPNGYAYDALDGSDGFRGEATTRLQSGKPAVDWVIVGGESGRDCRTCRVEWVRSLRDQCRAAGVAVFIKQLGGNAECASADHEQFMEDGCAKTLHSIGGRTLLTFASSKGGDPSEWPADLRVREMPEVAHA